VAPTNQEGFMKVARLLTLLALATGTASTVPAQQADTTHHAMATRTKAGVSRKHSKKEDLKAQAKISLDEATKIALGRVPNGKVKKHELEREDGNLLYSFDISVAGQPGVEEVHVSAIDGRVIKQVHESPAKEKAEAAAEKRAAKAKTKP
jgi:uncharacterized membrane protein YkoI